MFSKVFLICAFAFVASAYQIPYQGLEVPTYEKSGVYHPFYDLIKSSVVGSPYYGKYPYYTPEEETSYVPEGEYPSSYYSPYQYPYYYPQYVSSWLKYPYYAKFLQQYSSPISSYYPGQDIPSSYKYPGYGYGYGKEYTYPSYYKYPYYPYSYGGYQGQYPYSYGGYQGQYPYSYYGSSSYNPLLSKIFGGYYGSKYSVPEYMGY